MSDAPSPPPAAAPAAAPRSGVFPKILIGCFAVLVVIGIGVTGATWWLSHKLKGFAENPAAAMARLAVAGNPELEIVSEDEARKTVTIRSKKTGDVITMNAEDLKQGKLKFKDAKGEEVTFDASGAKEGGTVTVTSKEGSMVMGGGDVKDLPAWAPAFPGGKAQAMASKKTAAGGVEGGFMLQTSEPAAKVLDFYQAKLEGQGFKVERAAAQGDGATGSLEAKAEQDHRVVNVVAVGSGETTQVNVQFSSKP